VGCWRSERKKEEKQEEKIMASIICLRLVGNLKLEKKMKKFNFMMESVIFKMQRQNNNKKKDQTIEDLM